MNPLQRTSIFTLGIIFSFVFFIFILIGFYSDALSIEFAILMTVIVNFLLWILGPSISDVIYKWIYKARFFTHEEFSQQYPDLSSFIQSVSQNYKFSMPKIGFINDRNPTAFTYGSTKNHARIVFTKGLIHYLNPDEQKAVFAHELGHIYHQDFIVMTIAVTLAQILYELYAIFAKSNKKSNNKKGKSLAWIGLVSYVFYIVTSYLILYLSRVREYYADSFAAQVTKTPHSLIQALVKIAYGIVQAEDTETGKNLLESTRSLGILDIKNAGFISGIVTYSAEPAIVAEVMAFDNCSPWAKILELSSTHPLTGKRISALEKIAQSLNQKKLIDFEAAFAKMNIDRKKLYRDFSLEVVIYFLPFILPVIGFLLLGIGGALLAFALGSIFKIMYRLNENKAVPSSVIDQMRNPYASPMRGNPIFLEGQLVGRGVPGYIFSEDMMFQDKTGLAYLDYHSFLGFIGNFFFAISKVKKLLGQSVKVEGWFFRGLSHSVTLRKIFHGEEKISSHPKAWFIIRNLVIAAIGLILILS